MQNKIMILSSFMAFLHRCPQLLSSLTHGVPSCASFCVSFPSCALHLCPSSPFSHVSFLPSSFPTLLSSFPFCVLRPPSR